MNAIELACQWNQNHNPGTHVKHLRPGRLALQSTTKSAAFVAEDGQAMIRISGFGLVKLESLQVVEVKGKS